MREKIQTVQDWGRPLHAHLQGMLFAQGKRRQQKGMGAKTRSGGSEQQMKTDRIAEIKSRADCRELFRRFFPDHFREHGNSVCPFHGDSDPSCQVSMEKAHCHAEGKSWDAIDLYEAGTGLGKKAAIAALCSELGISDGNVPGTRRMAHKARSASGTVKDASGTVSHVERWKSLIAAPMPEDAALYWSRRALPKEFSASLQKQGMLGFDAKRKAIAFPVTDAAKKKLLGIQFVPIDGAPKKFAKGTNARNGFFRFGSGSDYCVVTEAVIDALSVYAACPGLSLEVVSIYSASQWKSVGQLGGTPVLFFDNDPAGIKATCRALRAFPGKVRIVDWSIAPAGCKDVNDLLKQGHPEVIDRMVRLSKCPREDTEVAAEVSRQLSRLETHVETCKNGDSKRYEDARADLERFRKEMEADGAVVALRGVIEERIAQINESHAVIMVGGKCAVMKEFEDPTFNRKDIAFSSIFDFKSFHANERYPVITENGRTKTTSIGNLWFESPQRRQYQGIVFTPDRENNGYYNLYRGFTVQPKEGDWSAFKDHIFSVIAGHDQEIFNYLVAWMAHLFQSPGGERPGVALVLRGKQGTGKGCFVGQIGQILGTHYLHVTNSNQLVGRFNNHLKDALLVFCDEGIWAGDKAAEGVLKGLVTEKYLTVEPKGKDAFMVQSHLRLVIASNNDWVVPAGMEERRFCVLDVNDAHMQDHQYFKRIFDQMDSGGREAMLHDLLNLDISGCNLKEFPKTAALIDQKMRTMKTSHKFWFERLRAGTPVDGVSEWETVILSSRFYEEYIQFANRIGNRHPAPDSVFGKELREVCPRIHRVQRNMEVNGNWCRAVTLIFDPLDECRKHFENIMGQTFDWDN